MFVSARDVVAAKTAGALTPMVGAAAGIAADKVLSFLPGNLKESNPTLYAAVVGAAVTTAVQLLESHDEQPPTAPASPWVMPGFTV